MRKLFILFFIAELIGCNTATLKKEIPSKVGVTLENVDTEPKIGDVRSFDGIEFIYIPYGTFYMGLKIGMEYERPLHKVTITEGFWLSKYEITQSQWEKVMAENPSRFKGTDHPVENISWNQVQNYIKKLNNPKYRLPTEAEWEYACRAGSTSKYFFGKDKTLLEQYCWFGESITKGSTHPVGQKKSNAWGLYDMYGNVYEYCEDIYDHTNNYYSESPEIDPGGPSKGKYRIMRGGAWGSPEKYCNSGSRNFSSPSKGSSAMGFRLLREE